MDQLISGQVFPVELHKTPYSFLPEECKMEETIDNNILNKSAHQKPSTLKPETILEQSKMISALITNKNNPNVTMVIGKVRIIKIGFISAFSIANTRAKTRAVIKLSI